MRKLGLLTMLLAAACSAQLPVADTGQAATAPGARPSAQLQFLAGWVQVQRRAIVPGGHVDVSYDQSRLSSCPNATVFGFARFDPGGQLFSSDEALGFDVPDGAAAVELWFHAVAPGCEAWDSDYGRNWKFPVAAAAPAQPGWAGDWGSSTNRACEHAAGVPQPITIDEYMRERSCIFIDADVWVPGVTDVAAPHPEYVLAQVEWAKDAAAPADSWLDYQGIVGHNARFRWTVPYELRNQADWSAASYSFRFSTDGNNWLRVAQSSGDDWTLVRAFTLQ